jgi:hypothetical protein
MDAKQKQAASEAKKSLKTKTGMCQSIRNLVKRGFSSGEIIEMGFNKSTVYRQANEQHRESEPVSHPRGEAKNPRARN